MNSNIPKWQHHTFLGWINGPAINNIKNIKDLSDITYNAQWINQVIQTSPDNKNLTPNSSLLGFAYIPKEFFINPTILNFKGKQEISLVKSNSFNVGVKDRTRTSSGRTVNALFEWTSEKNTRCIYTD
ncbi:hypothetical protein [Enterococcus faecium]|uniref:hypothetical protein n=1 Tax=Enterococcus faecium TaxID=1352 RepID=UPI0006B26004|nr:hypothetical protein [Enterococcus faecium]OUZ27900.1 hypothetical protein A5806_002508 [Enterococcus faecium]